MAGAKSYIIPHVHNGHWPYLLRHHHLAKVSALLIALKVFALVIVAITPNTAYLSTITTSRIVQLANEERSKIGAAPLAVNARLSEAAQQKGKDMLVNQYFAHISPSGVTPWFWMKQAGYSYSIAGENLAVDFLDAEDVITAWFNSPSHKANMLSREYTETGVAIVSGQFQGGESMIVVHMFGLPLSVAAPSPVSPPTPSPTIAPTVAAAVTTPLVTPHPTSTPAATPTTETTNAMPPPLILSPTFDRDQNAPSPSFVAVQDPLLMSVPSTISSLSRTATAGILIAVAILLSIAIAVRIRIQHPMLITHASFVILLACIFLLW